jgi:hypothetical protein
MYTYVYIYIYHIYIIHMSTYMHTYIHTYLHIYTYIYTYIHTYIGRICSQYYLHYKTVGIFKNRLDNWKKSLTNKDSDFYNNDNKNGVFTDTNNDGQKMLNKYGSELVNLRLFKSNISIVYLINLICDAQEFSELPVRFIYIYIYIYTYVYLII